LRTVPAVVLLALAASSCGGVGWHAGPVGHIEAGVGFAQGGPEQLVFDRAGNLYGVDCQDSSIFRIDPQGQLWIVGGTGNQGFSGNGGIAARADFTRPRRPGVRGSARRPTSRSMRTGTCFSQTVGMAPSAGSTARTRSRQWRESYSQTALRSTRAACSTSRNRRRTVQRLDRRGVLSTFARIAHPNSLAFDAHGDLYVAEPDENLVLRIDPHGTITTVAGTGRPGFSGDGGPATKARLNRPSAVAVDAKGNLYIGDHDNGAIRKVDRNGTITTFFNGRESA
jgi:serine/threonine-protein kinase